MTASFPLTIANVKAGTLNILNVKTLSARCSEAERQQTGKSYKSVF